MNDFSIMQFVVMTVSGCILLVMLAAAVRIINGKNDLEWTQLVSTRGSDGKQYADWNRIGQGCGVILCVWLPAVYSYSPKMDATGLAAVLAVVLAYLGGVSGYAATLRAKQGQVETTKTTEPATIAGKVTETKIETPPIKGKTK